MATNTLSVHLMKDELELRLKLVDDNADSLLLDPTFVIFNF